MLTSPIVPHDIVFLEFVEDNLNGDTVKFNENE